MAADPLRAPVTLAEETWEDAKNTASLPFVWDELPDYQKRDIAAQLLSGAAFGQGTATLRGAKPVTEGMTVPNTTKGWKLGDPINNLTKRGNIPVWDTVRARYWKNEALYNAANYSAENLARMKQGLAPQRMNPITGIPESMELHHWPPQREGGLFDVEQFWPSQHTDVDPFRNLGQ